MALKNLWRKVLAHPTFKAFCLAAVVVLIAVLFVDFIVMPVFAGKFTTRQIVPLVTGLPADSAQVVLTAAGFQSEWTEEARYSAEIPEGHVLVQQPIGGHESKVGRTIFLTKSRGLREVAVPELRGKSLKQATMSIARAGLIEGETIKGAHLSIPRGVVIRTIPASGKMIRIGDTVSVVISAGVKSGKVLLPSYQGWSLDSARASLLALGFQVGQIVKQNVPDSLKIAIQKQDSSKVLNEGSVFSELPRSGEFLPKGTSVDLIIVN